MSVVVGTVVRRIAEVSKGPESPEELLEGVGLPPNADPTDWIHESVGEDAFYDFLESATPDDDWGLPFRYANSLRVDDFGALGLAFKTATTLRDALLRIVRYILVISDTLEYELHDVAGGAEFVLNRPGHRRGAQLANECALAADLALLRRVTDSTVAPLAVSFQHARPPSIDDHRQFYGCPLRYDDEINALHLGDETLGIRTRLADEGLSAYFLAALDDLKEAKADRSLPTEVHSVVTDALPDGRPNKPQIARRLGMSERTLHRRLAEHGETFQAIATRAQREAAESLLVSRHTSIAEVAFLTGFSDQSAFTRAFKSWTGQTPLTFRASATAS